MESCRTGFAVQLMISRRWHLDRVADHGGSNARRGRTPTPFLTKKDPFHQEGSSTTARFEIRFTLLHGCYTWNPFDLEVGTSAAPGARLPRTEAHTHDCARVLCLLSFPQITYSCPSTLGFRAFFFLVSVRSRFIVGVGSGAA